ncbi:MAG: hypothetical protein JSW26_28910 [Desulfobacterales bacterium]|nr:MAG: hypothetical protein JSW26_28910 [Desulfobacterales bacterium]
MNSYHREQIDAMTLVKTQLDKLPASKRRELEKLIADYLKFRSEIDGFLSDNFGQVCTRTCYQSRLSACCSREGIITFFADIVVNLMVSDGDDFDSILAVLNKPNEGFKCVYLTEKGCLWRIKPIVCQMFLCDRSKELVFGKNHQLQKKWKLMEQKRKLFTWPDRPVLFDALESYFMNIGCRSPLMYLHNSPGLSRVKDRSKRIKGSEEQ